MKQGALIIALIFTYFSGFSIGKEPIKFEIFLIRHAVVAMEKPILCSAAKAARLQESYNHLPVYNFNPNKIQNLLEGDSYTIYTSTMQRAIETAEMISQKQLPIVSSSVFNEYELPMISIPLIPLPYVVWTSISRLFWLSHLSKKNESRSQARKRMKRAAGYLESLAKENKQVMLIAHGFLIREVRRELRKKGWIIEYKEGNGNLAVTKLVKTSIKSDE